MQQLPSNNAVIPKTLHTPYISEQFLNNSAEITAAFGVQIFRRARKRYQLCAIRNLASTMFIDIAEKLCSIITKDYAYSIATTLDVT